MASTPTLEFEKPIFELEKQIDELKKMAGDQRLTVDEEIAPLEKKLTALRQEVYRNLSPLQRLQVARSAKRPFTLDYIRLCFTDFIELAGDRLFREDPAIVGGWARLEGETVMVMGHQRGRDTKENLRRNFGMPHPERSGHGQPHLHRRNGSTLRGATGERSGCGINRTGGFPPNDG